MTWKASIPGKGWSSPVVWGEEVWLTTAIETFPTEAEEKELLKNEKQPGQRKVAKSVSLRAICVHPRSGKITKNLALFSIENPDAIHLLNSYASPTPVIEQGRIYCHFGTFGTACVDTANGEVVWQRRLPLQHAVGPGSSPIVWRHLLVLVCDGMDAQYVTALHKDTGETVWRTDRPPMEGDDGDFHKAYCTPLVANWNGNDQLLVPGAQWFVSYAPTSGETLWQINHGRGFSNVAAPVFADGVSYLITGFTKPELWAIPVGYRGELDASKVLWEQKKQIPKKSSPVIVGHEIYVIADNGVLSCVDMDTGEIRWSARLEGNYSASPLYADGKIYICSHEGKTTVVKPNRDRFDMLAQNELDGQLMASPVPADGALFIRSDQHLYRLENN